MLVLRDDEAPDKNILAAVGSDECNKSAAEDGEVDGGVTALYTTVCGGLDASLNPNARQVPLGMRLAQAHAPRPVRSTTPASHWASSRIYRDGLEQAPLHRRSGRRLHESGAGVSPPPRSRQAGGHGPGAGHLLLIDPLRARRGRAWPLRGIWRSIPSGDRPAGPGPSRLRTAAGGAGPTDDMPEMRRESLRHGGGIRLMP